MAVSHRADICVIKRAVVKRETEMIIIWHYGRKKSQQKIILENFNGYLKIRLYGGGNYYASMLSDSQCWIVWDKQKSPGMSFADVELAWTSFDLASRIFRFKWDGMLQGNMKHKEYKIHPTQKPVALYEWLLQRFANPDDIILDTHVGSASSLIACHRTRHKFVGFEIDPTYYEMSKKRLDAEMAQMSIFDFIEEGDK